MEIDNQDTKVVFTFSPRGFFLVADSKEGYVQWSLNNRIDRSEKGKDDDVGLPRIFLSEAEADLCKKAGFSYITL